MPGTTPRKSVRPKFRSSSPSDSTFLPGSTLGVLGGGQLGRMLAFEAKRLGYRVVTLDPSPDSPCGQVADDRIIAAFDDVEAHRRLAARCDAVTYEFENVDLRCVRAIEAMGRVVRPGSRVLEIAQDRILEKEFARAVGIKTTDFRKIESADDLEFAATDVGFPAVLKTVRGGYDGKGQAAIRNWKEASGAFERLRSRPLIWERWTPFVKELSVVCARGLRGEIAAYPPTENVHRDNILDTAVAPARIPESVARRARRIAAVLAEKLELVGVFCVELFLLRDESLWVNEIAPRPHNSGHYTIDACAVSQFEQQLRAVCGLPLGSAAMRSGAAAMINLLGTGSGDRLGGVDRALADPDIFLHLYGKSEAHSGRKMGHVTALGRTRDEALRRVRRARSRLHWAR